MVGMKVVVSYLPERVDNWIVKIVLLHNLDKQSFCSFNLSLPSVLIEAPSQSLISGDQGQKLHRAAAGWGDLRRMFPADLPIVLELYRNLSSVG